MRVHGTMLAASTHRQISRELQDCIEAGLRMTEYTERRMAERSIRWGWVIEAVRDGVVVEYHENDSPTWRRVLMRAVGGEASGVCAVIDLDTREIITTYRNKPDDDHRTLRTGQYMLGGGIR